uniref:Uncharacterized protein n=1 Tax=Micrurus carvalhoi TaxID=3147026 RepID=A0A2H6N3C9_9SAUR
MEKFLRDEKSSFSCSPMSKEATEELEWRVASPIFTEEEMKIPLPPPSKIPGQEKGNREKFAGEEKMETENLLVTFYLRNGGLISSVEVEEYFTVEVVLSL